MIAFLDTDKKAVILYTKKGSRIIPFHRGHELKAIAKDSPITYVIEAKVTNANSIMGLLQSMGYTFVEEERLVAASENNLYIHTPKKGTLMVPDVPELSFQGRFDIRLLDDDMKRLIKKSSSLQKCLKNRSLKIIDEAEKSKLFKERKEERKKNREQQQRIDESYEKLMVDMDAKSLEAIAQDGGIASLNDFGDDSMLITDTGGGRESYNTYSEKVEQVSNNASIPTNQLVDILEGRA